MNLCENIDIKSSAELASGTGEHDGLDVVAPRGLRVLVLEPGDDDGVERVDGRVGDGDERDAVGAHLHGDPDRPRGHGRPLAGSLDRGGGRWWGGETARERWEGNDAGGDVRKCFKLGRLERFFLI